MTAPSFHATPINLRTASEDQYAAVAAFANRLRAERLPDDVPHSLDEQIARWQNLPSFVDLTAWVVWNVDRTMIIARGELYMVRTPENQHLAQFTLEVLPELREQGIGRHLLTNIADMARRDGRCFLITETSSSVPAGGRCMQRMGATKGLESHINQLRLSELDQALVRHWIARGNEHGDEFELGCWSRGYPEEELGAIAALYDVMNQQPRDQLAVEDVQVTPAHLRQMEHYARADGSEQWTIYAREQATRTLAGFTEVRWNAHRPEIIQQGNTGVFPGYRNRGLGRWLKAAMLEKIVHEHPEVTFIRTNNADSNGAMLKINEELGFKPYIAKCLWQVETAQVEDYLRKPSKNRPKPSYGH